MENNKSVTAVKWLEEEFIKLEQTTGVYGVMYELIEKAKEIEKGNIIEAYEIGESEWTEITYENGNDYYNKTYNKTYNK